MLSPRFFFSFPSFLLRGELKRGQLDGSITAKSKHGCFSLNWEWDAWREGMTAGREGMTAGQVGLTEWRYDAVSCHVLSHDRM